MIGRLRGTVVEIRGAQFVIDVQGVGYDVTGTRECIANLTLQAPATITTFTDVRQDEIRLYGFADELEKTVFLLLLKVSGIGPRTGLDMLSGTDKFSILRAIGAQNVAALQAIKGIGKKTAERIIVELKDRVAEHVLDPALVQGSVSRNAEAEPFLEAMQALEALGFHRREAESALKRAQENGVSPEQEVGAIVREALRFV